MADDKNKDKGSSDQKPADRPSTGKIISDVGFEKTDRKPPIITNLNEHVEPRKDED